MLRISRNIVLILFILSCSTTNAQVRSPSSIKTCISFIERLLSLPAGLDFIPPPIIDKTWGVELELSIPKGMTQKDVANELMLFFKKKRFSNIKLLETDAHLEGFKDYTITYKSKGAIHSWQVPFEETLLDKTTNEVKGIEVATSVFSSKKDEKLFIEVVNKLKEIGLSPIRNLGGTHVHHGTNDLSIEKLKRVIDGYLKAYDQLEKFFSPDKGREYIDAYALATGLQKLRNYKDQHGLLSQLDKSEIFFEQGPIRFNRNYNTLETRLFNSSLSGKELLFNVKFSKAFIERILSDYNFYNQLGSMSYQEIFKALDLVI